MSNVNTTSNSQQHSKMTSSSSSSPNGDDTSNNGIFTLTRTFGIKSTQNNGSSNSNCIHNNDQNLETVPPVSVE